jgi:FkbM family methyltransferase
MSVTSTVRFHAAIQAPQVATDATAHGTDTPVTVSRVLSRTVQLLQTMRLYGVAKRANDLIAAFLPRERARRARMQTLYSTFVRSGDVCFDVGANIGNRTATLVELGAQVVAVEPQQVCIEQLRKRFGSEPRVTIVPKALGRSPGVAEMQISQAHGISSMSRGWVESVRKSGRFAMYRWDRTERVVVTTMDALIADYGRPAFCKLDVEGFESEVLAGLSAPVPALSFECAPEYLDNATSCIDRLEELASYEYNYNLNETMNLGLSEWVSANQMCILLQSMAPEAFADVYARLRRA